MLTGVERMRPAHEPADPKVLAAIVLAAAALRLALVPMFAGDPTGTAGRTVDLELVYTPHDIKYILWGNQLVKTGPGLYGALDPSGRHYAYGPVLAYVCLAWSSLLGPSILATKLLFALADLISLYCVYRIGMVIGGGRAGIAAALFYAFSPVPVFVCAVRAKEDALMMALVLAAYVFALSARPKAVLLAGPCAAASFAVKPAVIFLAVPLLVFFVQTRAFGKAVRFTVTFLGAVAVFLGPEWIRSGVVAYRFPAEHAGYIGGLSLFSVPGILAGFKAAYPAKGIFSLLSALIRDYPTVELGFFALYAAAMLALYRAGSREPDKALLARSATALLLAAIIKRTVWSHYLFWAFPFIALGWALKKVDLPRWKVTAGALLGAIALIWFSLTFREGSPSAEPSGWNAVFLGCAFACALLCAPGRTGLYVACLITAMLAFKMGRVALPDHWLNLQKPYLTALANRFLPVLLCYLGCVLAIADQFDAMRRSNRRRPCASATSSDG